MNHNTISRKPATAGAARETGVIIKDNTYQSRPYWPPAYADKRHIICPLCGQKVHYVRRATHRCFKFHLSEIARNVQQMNRD
jgi:hypothetical protein